MAVNIQNLLKKYNELCRHGFCLRTINNDGGDKLRYYVILDKGNWDLWTYPPSPRYSLRFVVGYACACEGDLPPNPLPARKGEL